jgi:hypothetical protein
MHGTVVMLIALSSLGCDHKSCAVDQAPPALDARYGAQGDGHALAPSGYPAYTPSDSDCGSPGHSGHSWRATLCSFILGRDPDVPTAREIEATFSSGGFGQYRQFATISADRQRFRN